MEERMSLQLFAHPFSSYCQKVLIALWADGTEFEYRMLDQEHPENMAELERHWPFKQFPLLLDDGRPVVTVMSCCNSISPYHDGTTHIVMSPIEFMQRLAALVPRPRLHLIRFHGVLAPNAKHRSAIIPNLPVNTTHTAEVHRNTAHHSAPARISWARLLKRVFEIDIEKCPHCGGTLEDHRRHRKPRRDRQDPRSSRLVRPGTAPNTCAAIRPTPIGLI